MNVAQTTRYASSANWIDGIDAQSKVTSSFAVNGTATMKANRNIHFMKVTTEYFPISGLNMPRYMEKLRLLRISMKMPNIVVSAGPPALPVLLIIK